MLLPALTQAKEAARLATCLNRKKQLGLADAMYIDDSDEWFVPQYAHGVTLGVDPAYSAAGPGGSRDPAAGKRHRF